MGTASYGGDKGIFAYGNHDGNLNVSNLVSNLGVVSANVNGVGTARRLSNGTGYGGDKGIIRGGTSNAHTAISNLISNTGVVAADTSGVGSPLSGQGAAGYSITA